jgi:hypothetical protein
VEVALSEEESAALQQALRSYLSDLRMEISDTEDREWKEGLRRERTVLEDVVSKLEAARGSSTLRDQEGREVVRIVSLWWTEDE